MPDNLQVQRNAVPNQSSDISEALWRLEISDNQDGGDAAESSPYPDRPGEPDCLYYMRTGSCSYGSNCRFNHPVFVAQGAMYNGELPERIGQPDCEYFLKTGTCKYGGSCKYHHPRDRRGAGPVRFNILGLPMRQEEKSCPYYLRTGSCKFGVSCKFNHPQPSPVGNMLHPARPGALGSAGTPFMPASGVPYTGAVPAWSLPRVQYMPGPCVQGQQSFVPVLVSPSQGAIAAQDWNTYVGNVSPVLPNLGYNSINLEEPYSNGQLASSTATPTLPDRPDQPECRYFMNNGTCKYGSDCKFHHPKQRIAQSATNPLGLPSRPGQAVCSYYNMYGLCKYGPSCKFDHPSATYPYNYGFTLPVLDSSFMKYPSNNFTMSSHEALPQTVSKSSEWVQKADPSNNKRRTTNSIVVVDSTAEEATTVSCSLPGGSETLQDQSG
ncbi:zinc finger CCCH domain-containing protein ZFN-like [Cucurbita moschata]|uniref:Zinc finger CCCH domain-containing protein ZFN-like n=1 Tax=Cucurbita moschata TaxID=3662 RepID=A0A6J1FY55_CUCMO|nr:zinc finger CCCH domain-containing protein ZFN-like [Cucurbita moschata]